MFVEFKMLKHISITLVSMKFGLNILIQILYSGMNNINKRKYFTISLG